MSTALNLLASSLAGVATLHAASTDAMRPFRSSGTASGYSGYFAMPSTAVVPEGLMNFGFTTGPLIGRQVQKGAVPASTDNYSTVMGLLPDFEVGASFLAAAPFNGLLDDRAISVKYRPIHQKQFGFSLAMGSTDVHGTNRRTTKYVVAGRDFGRFSVDLGYLSGHLGGIGAGAHFRLTKRLGVIAEHVHGESRVGLLGNLGRLTVSGGYGSDKAPIAGATYTFPLYNEVRYDSSGGDAGAGESSIAGALARIGGGGAEAGIHDDKLYASYEDVDGRDPVGKFAAALKACAEMTGDVGRIRLTARRLGVDLVSLETSTDELRRYLKGEDNGEFEQNVSLADGSMGKVPGDSTKAGRITSALITVTPTVKYRLGLKDQLPNTETLEVRGTVPLPGQFLATVVASPTVHTQYQERNPLPTPAFGVYRAGHLGNGVWGTAGIEQGESEPMSAAMTLAFLPQGMFRARGTYSQLFSSRNYERNPYSLEAGLEDPHGDYYLFGRSERFRQGDTGNTLGLTRRFGQTWVTVKQLWSHDRTSKIERVGINFQIPLPNWSVRSGGVALTTAPYTEFTYLPRTLPRVTAGRGESRLSVFAPDQDLTARGQLTVRFIRQHFERLRGASSD